MYLESKEIIERPLEEIFALVRDDLAKIIPFLPNIETIKVQKREENKNNNTVNIVNHWYAKVEIPPVAQAFVKKELFAWKDTAIWHNDEFYVEYQLESFWANDLFDAKGKNIFKALDDDRTELTVTCNVILHPDKVPGVPKFLVKKVLPYVEPMVQEMLRPNLNGLGEGLRKYFAQNNQ